jgi:hypothetical protein
MIESLKRVHTLRNSPRLTDRTFALAVEANLFVWPVAALIWVLILVKHLSA